jgi:hypothetical protein
MTAPHADQLIEGYLARLRTAAADLPSDVREELVNDVRIHLQEARARQAEETDASILNLFDRLGEPSVLVAEARERGPNVASESGHGVTGYAPGILEVAALVLLVLIWPVGVILLWLSPAWKLPDKLIGTLLPPGGYPGILILALMPGHPLAGHFDTGFGPCSSGYDEFGNAIPAACSSGPHWWDVAMVVALLVILYTLPLITAGYLAVRLRWGRRQQAAIA